MTKCFYIQGVNCAGQSFSNYEGRFYSLSTVAGGCGVSFVADSVVRSDLGSNESVTITQVDCSLCGGPAGCSSPTYDCSSGVCVENSDGTGIYNSLSDCQANCAWYDCTGGSCIQNTAGTGTYTSLAACQTGCAWYDCINSTCISNITYGTPGFYHSLALCNASCGGATCPAGQSCFDPSDLPCPTCPTCPACPTCPDCPDCPEEGGFCPPCPDCPPGSATCPTGQTCQLPTGEDVNFVNISAPIFLGTCDSSGNPVMGTRSVGVVQGTENAEFLKLQELAKIQGNEFCNVDVPACPDGWLIRPEYHRPQALYQFAEVDGDGNVIGSPKYRITIPHHQAAKPTDGISNYVRGNWELIYLLSDNSKVTLHTIDEDTANSLLAEIQALINPTYLVGADISKSGFAMRNTPIAQIPVKNRTAKYYSTGTKNLLPDWLAKF